MKTALVHYWLAGMGGGERVLEALCRIWPDADVYTHVVDLPALSPWLQSRKISTTFISSLPFSRTGFRYYLPLMPLALEQLDLRGYDLVVSSESGPAKGVLTRPDTAHVCYCHSPMRYLWDFYQEYLREKSFLARPFMRSIFHYLRMWDVASANRVDAFAANSHYVGARIRKAWRRDAAVIHPPVDIAQVADPRFREQGEELRRQHGDFYLCAGRLVEYKRIDLAIEACAGLGRQLVIIGAGPERQRLEKLAAASPGAQIRFAGRVENREFYAWLHGARALVFPGEEDFGIVPVESLAAGTPVVAYGRGGVVDTVRDGESGVFFGAQTAQALSGAILRFESCPAFAPDALRSSVAGFSEERFRREMLRLAERTLECVRAGLPLP